MGTVSAGLSFCGGRVPGDRQSTVHNHCGYRTCERAVCRWRHCRSRERERWLRVLCQGATGGFDYNYFHAHSRVVSSELVPAGPCRIEVHVDREGAAGHAVLAIGGTMVGQVIIPNMAMIVSSTGMDVGRSISPVCHDYEPPFEFQGALRRVTFELAAGRSPSSVRAEAEAHERLVMAQQ